MILAAGDQRVSAGQASVPGGLRPQHWRSRAVCPGVTRSGCRGAEQWTTAFPDWRFDLLSLVAEGDWVAAHLPYSGTFTKPIFGVAPTGRFARVDEMVIFRIAGVQAVAGAADGRHPAGPA